jgi:hypothetical protein
MDKSMNKRKTKVIKTSKKSKKMIKPTRCQWCRKPFTNNNTLVEAVFSFASKTHTYFGHYKCHNIMGEILGVHGHKIFKGTKVVREISDR